jgi:hypothetical protein
MVRAHSRASAWSVIPGNKRRTSMAADSSPSCSKMARIAAAASSEATNMAASMVTHAAAGKPIPGLAVDTAPLIAPGAVYGVYDLDRPLQVLNRHAQTGPGEFAITKLKCRIDIQILHEPAGEPGVCSKFFRVHAACISSTNGYHLRSTSRFAPVIRTRTIARILSISAVRRPCVVRAFRMRSNPSAVRGPVLAPPCILHFPQAIAGALQGSERPHFLLSNASNSTPESTGHKRPPPARRRGVVAWVVTKRSLRKVSTQTPDLWDG